MSTPCVKGGMRLSEALDSMQLAYNPMTKQLHFVSPKVEKKPLEELDSRSLSKKGSFSDEGISVSTGEKSDTSDSPKSTLLWTGHHRGKDGGSFSSTVSSLSECSGSGGYISKDEEEGAAGPSDARKEDDNKFKKKGLSGFFSRGVFPWKSGGSVLPKSHEGASGVAWRLFGSKSSNNLSAATEPPDAQPQTAGSSGANTPHHHRRQGSSTSEKQFEDLVASSIALIQHDRPSNLPAKCCTEEQRHRAEHARIMEAARRRGEREAAARRARYQENIRCEEALARNAREWTTTVLPDWENMKSSKRTMELWWCGLPPSIRGKVWQLSIENKLNITIDMYHDCVARAKKKLQEAQQRRKRLKVNRNNDCKDCKNYKDSSIDEVDRVIPDNELKKDIDCDKADEKMQLNNEIKCGNSGNENSDKSCKKETDHVNAKTESETITAGKGMDTDEKRPEAKKLHRNLSEQNLKSHSIGMCPSRKNSKSNPNLVDYSDECSMELIQLDIARTFPHLCIFQPGGPYFDVLYELLSAYVCYRPDIGYVQGMSFLGAMLILNMEGPQAFVCFANLLDGTVLKSAYTRDGASMQRLWNAYAALLRYNLPALCGRLAPELYLLEWLYTAFAKAMPLDAACRVWDLFLRDGDTFLFRSALGVLHLYQDTLKDMDFISAAQFLTKLPEDLSSDALFRSISCITMTLDGLSFEQLVDSCPVNEHILDDEVERL